MGWKATSSSPSLTHRQAILDFLCVRQLRGVLYFSHDGHIDSGAGKIHRGTTGWRPLPFRTDVIAQSLGMLRAQEEFISSNAAELREKVAVGMEQIRRGEVIDGCKAIQNLRVKLRSRRSYSSSH